MWKDLCLSLASALATNDPFLVEPLQPDVFLRDLVSFPPLNWATNLAEKWVLGMVRKRHSDEGILKLLGEIDLKLAESKNVQSACRSMDISAAPFYNWQKRFGGMGRSQKVEMRSLEKENARLKKIVAELEPEKLIFKESRTYLKPRARRPRSSAKPSPTRG